MSATAEGSKPVQEAAHHPGKIEGKPDHRDGGRPIKLLGTIEARIGGGAYDQAEAGRVGFLNRDTRALVALISPTLTPWRRRVGVDRVEEEGSSRSVPANRSAISRSAAGRQPGQGWTSMPLWRREDRIVSSFLNIILVPSSEKPPGGNKKLAEDSPESLA